MNLIIIAGGQPVTTTIAIAEGTDNDHASVIKLVRAYQDDLQEFGRVGFEIQSFETAGGTQEREVGILNEQQATLILTFMRNSEIVRAFKKRLVKEFWDMRQSAPKFDPATLTRIDILKLAMESEEGRIKAEAERDHAIATKSQIGSKREATAMANVAKANREVSRLMDRLGFNTKHATVKAVEGATKRTFGPQGWRPLSNWCKSHSVSAIDVPDPLYGSVKSWPADAWGEIYGIDLTDLFSEKATT